MTSIELAVDLESVGVYTDAAAMLRCQHEAIVQLRGALANMIEHCDLHQDVFCAEQALKDTEDLK